MYAVAIDTNAVCAFAINATTGVLKAIAGSPFTTDIIAPDSVAVDPTGRFLMAANDCCGDTSGITVYTITAKTGKLKAVKGSPFLPPSGAFGASAVAVDPSGRYVYVAFANTGGAAAYSVNASSGKLTLAGSVLAGGALPWAITTDVTGSYVYMTNNDSTIDGYAIANATGELTALKGSPFSGNAPTRGIAADPSGQYLYIANASQILGYGINPSTGVLTVLSTSPYTAGNAPIDLTLAGTIK